MKRIYNTFIFALVFSGNAWAAQVRPPVASEIISVPSTMSEDLVQEINIGKFKAKFEETTLGEILEVIGHGIIDHFGDASESNYWLCYTLPKQRIWLISNGEMGGSNHTLTQVSAVTLNGNVGENPSCPSLQTSFQPIEFDFGWLGSDQKTIVKYLGEPSGATENSLTFFYSGKQPGFYRGEVVDWDITSYIEISFENNKAKSIRASHITSY